MTLMRFDPFRELDRLSEQVMAPIRHSPMAMEAYRRGDEFFVHFDVPGVVMDDIDVTVERNVVSVRVERRPAHQPEDEVIINERPQGTFRRQLFLADNLDAGQLSADCDMGVLTLTIPVSEESKPRRVELSGGEGQPQQIEQQEDQPALDGQEQPATASA
jgi:HSP20 family protein